MWNDAAYLLTILLPNNISSNRPTFLCLFLSALRSQNTHRRFFHLPAVLRHRFPEITCVSDITHIQSPSQTTYTHPSHNVSTIKANQKEGYIPPEAHQKSRQTEAATTSPGRYLETNCRQEGSQRLRGGGCGRRSGR